MDSKEYRLTTIDNPYNPFTQFDDWYQFDLEKGYDCCGFIARLTNDSNKLLENEQIDLINHTIDKIVLSPYLNPNAIYIKVHKDTVIHPIAIDLAID